MLVAFTIVLIIWSNPAYLTLGAVLAVVAGVFFLVLPVGKGAMYLLGSPRLMGHRPRAFAASAATLAIVLVLVLLGVIPAPSAAYAPAILRAQDEVPLRTGEAGFVERVHLRVGDTVKQNDVVITLRNPEVVATLALAEAAYEGALARLDEAAADAPTKRQIEERTVAQAQAELTRARQRVEDLILRAPLTGILVPLGGVPVDLENLPGRFLQRGSLIGFVATPDSIVVRAVVSEPGADTARDSQHH